MFIILPQSLSSVFVNSAVGKTTPGSHEVDADLIPPLELCIRTRSESLAMTKTQTHTLLQTKEQCLVVFH